MMSQDFQEFTTSGNFSDFGLLVAEHEAAHDRYIEMLMINNAEYREQRVFVRSIKEQRAW